MWTDSLTLLRDLTAGRPDPLGLNALLAGLLLSTPALASIGLAAFALSSILAIAIPFGLVPRALAACAIVQCGLVGGLFATEDAVRRVGAALQQFVAGASDPAASARVADWVARYNSGAASSVTPLVWLLGAYVLTLVLVWPIAQGRRPSAQAPEGGGVEQPVSSQTSLPAGPIQPAPSEFKHSSYSVRPRTGWLAPFTLRLSEYDITSIPPMSEARYSLSWTTGVIRREPNGPAVLSVRAVRAGRFGRRSYVVADAQSGSPSGTLVPVGSDWEVRDAWQGVIAHVLETESGVGHARYVAKAGEQEVCRFLWGFAGLTVASAELQIEFLPGAEAQFDKGLAIALGPILEEQARRASRS